MYVDCLWVECPQGFIDTMPECTELLLADKYSDGSDKGKITGVEAGTYALFFSLIFLCLVYTQVLHSS